MGRHADEGRKRGVAAWPIITAVAVLLIGGLIAAYFIWLRSDAGSGAVDQGCTGSVKIEIAAGDASAAAMKAVAEAFNATKPTARSACIVAEVTTLDSAVAAAGLITGWTGQAYPEPALWLPDNAADLNLVSAKAPDVVAGYNDEPIATSPVVLAVAARNAKSFPASFSWAGILADAAAGKSATMADGSPLTLAIGDPRTDRATRYSIESMLAGATGAAVTAEQVTTAAGGLSALFGKSAFSATTRGLLGDLAGSSTSFNAVAVVESALISFNATATSPLTAIRPAGATGGDSITAVGLSADWVNATQQEGAAAIIAYLRTPAATVLLQESGLQVPGTNAADTNAADTNPPGTNAPGTASGVADPSATGGTESPPTPTGPGQILPAAGPEVVQAIASAFGLPSQEATTGGTTPEATTTGG